MESAPQDELVNDFNRIENMDNVINLGAKAFKKFGAENVTLFQLSQAEEEGLFGFDVEHVETAQIIEFPKRTQSGHIA